MLLTLINVYTLPPSAVLFESPVANHGLNHRQEQQIHKNEATRSQIGRVREHIENVDQHNDKPENGPELAVFDSCWATKQILLRCQPEDQVKEEQQNVPGFVQPDEGLTTETIRKKHDEEGQNAPEGSVQEGSLIGVLAATLLHQQEGDSLHNAVLEHSHHGIVKGETNVGTNAPCTGCERHYSSNTSPYLYYLALGG